MICNKEGEQMTRKDALRLAISEYEKDLRTDKNNEWVKSVLKGLKDAQEARAATPEDDNLKALAGIIAGAKGGVCEFASRINVANMVNVVTVIKVDWDYIVEDLRNHSTRFKASDFVHTEFNVVNEIKRLLSLRITPHPNDQQGNNFFLNFISSILVLLAIKP